MAKDILKEIVEKRKTDIDRNGISFGFERPGRKRPLHPFIENPGTILEIKRSSPSKGNIAMDLSPEGLARQYAAAKTSAISVLTEGNYFHGSLPDLLEAAKGAPDVALLRKDFLLYPEEIDVAFDFGADAVLLIARILSDEALLKMAGRARELGMTPFVEVRTEDDLRKLHLVQKEGATVAGVNARDLKTFTMDPLIPAAFRKHLGPRAVFESGIHSGEDAAFARKLGFEGILVGEAVAKDPDAATGIVRAFLDAKGDRQGAFWRALAERREDVRRKFKGSPLVKVCGITNAEDANLAASLSADMLGFVLCKKSPRKTDEKTVREVSRALNQRLDEARPLLVGVVAEEGSTEEALAISLAREGVLDAVQFHGYRSAAAESASDFGFYEARNIRCEDEAETVRKRKSLSRPRTLIDAYAEDAPGGTGKRIADKFVEIVKRENALWLAGGISPENIREVVERFSPELVDLSSSLEASPGKKSEEKLRAFFKNIRQISFPKDFP